MATTILSRPRQIWRAQVARGRSLSLRRTAAAVSAAGVICAGWAAALPGGLACSGLCWVSGLCLIFLLGLLGFFFRFGLLGKAAILQGKIGICNVHHQITGTGTIASVLNANANGDLRSSAGR